MGHAFLQLFFFRPPFLCRHRLIASRTPRSFSHDDMPATNSRVVAFDEDDEYRRRAVKKARRLKLAVAVQAATPCRSGHHAADEWSGPTGPQEACVVHRGFCD